MREASVCTLPNGKVAYRVGVSEDRNKRCRRVMEDAHTFQLDFNGVPGQGFFGLFDGHGGKSAAEWCGEHFHETLESCLAESLGAKPVVEILESAFLQADGKLAENKGGHSGCTVATALMLLESKPDRKLYTANVGDARTVLCRDGKAVRLSYDHKGSDPQESQRITDKGGYMMGNRVNGMLAVTRALGDTAMKEFVIGNPYTCETELCPSDSFLIVACDGLWDVCEDQVAVDLVKDVSDPQRASEILLQYALNNFSSDNLTVMVVRLEQL
ncbi:phosphatase 2C-like domain-containing protein [Thamnocephalis sphaerospora]|uniref:Phosphatase 2C-like domain-containing protein n=1 Tax=Thamnocephalis sphaerospora TaxID=78915 RepID=A0A4P9XUL8_9FUNG|nr:phosphatase 2C-like domain-containing protein [Thamnocephalis sphaerospora]|eukprot:RKP09281.1 phosphatase 2C-like domain-containing protein [Thamnocephalis sphaerospora]